MKGRSYKKWIFIIPFLAFIIVFCLGYVSISKLPDTIFIQEDESEVIVGGFPINVDITGDDQTVAALNFNGTSLKDNSTYNLAQPIKIDPSARGSYQISLKLLGVIPVKDINIVVDKERRLIPGGQSIGVLLYTKGALVVGSSDIITSDGSKQNPALKAGIVAGDVIIKVDGMEVEDADHLSSLINDLSEENITFTVQRGTAQVDIQVKPVKDADDGLYKIGLWVRDSTAGVGTLTYYDPLYNTFGGLGHSITDIDTGQELSVKNGEIIHSDIIDIAKGEKGAPGELKGLFNTSKSKIGKIEKNTEVGIYGEAYEPIQSELYKEGLPIASQEDVKLGSAQILTTLDDQGVKAYDCKIVKKKDQSTQEVKSFVIEVTDKELLEKTGGIVQGMSGSPVVQNGKIIGAVTHVFINDPTKGYGIYIEWMLENSDD